MGAQLLSIEGTQIKLEVTIDLSRSMLTSEENIQQSLNEGGCLATSAALINPAIIEMALPSTQCQSSTGLKGFKAGITKVAGLINI
jgi:hypothetical protein